MPCRTWPAPAARSSASAHTAAPPGAACAFSNISLLIGPDGRILTQQAKMVPMPFFDDGEPGRTQSVTSTDCGAVGTYICYDGMFTDMPRHVVQAGAQVLLVPSMDARDWPAQERWQHAAMAPLRSIELRRCAVRANGAGISQIIDAAGRVIASRTDEEGAGVILGNVYPLSERTAFVRGGHLLALAAGIGLLVLVAWLSVRSLWTHVAAPTAARIRWRGGTICGNFDMPPVAAPGGIQAGSANQVLPA